MPDKLKLGDKVMVIKNTDEDCIVKIGEVGTVMAFFTKHGCEIISIKFDRPVWVDTGSDRIDTVLDECEDYFRKVEVLPC